jgi:hypothetical protein
MRNRVMNRFILLLICAMAAGCSGLPHRAQTPVDSQASRWIRTELFFGLSKPDGSVVETAEWNAFLEEHILSRFPDGLTVVDAAGRYLDRHHRMIREPSKMIIILYPPERSATANSNLIAISAEYCSQFKQESVLRADSIAKASFLSGSKP